MHQLWQKFGTRASIVFVAAALWCLWLWQPERQIRKHHDHFLDAAENRSWRRFGSFVDEKYGDRWGHDKPFLIRETSEILRQFFTVKIQRDLVGLEIGNGTATITARLKLDGEGTPIAQYTVRAVNGIDTPFVFEWRRRSWKPWDWKLVRADNPRLQVHGALDF